MVQLKPEIDHLLRRAGFGDQSRGRRDLHASMSTSAAVGHLVDYEGRLDDVACSHRTA